MKILKTLLKNWTIWITLYAICAYVLVKVAIVTNSDLKCIAGAFFFGIVGAFLGLAIFCDVLRNNK